MKTTLDHLPENKQAELQRLVEILSQPAEVEMIILFGSYARGTWVEEYAEDGIHFQYQSDFDLLLIVKTRSLRIQTRLESEAMAEIENLSDLQTPVSVIVHDIDFVNRRLEKGQYFFSDIKKQGIVLYDTGELTLKEAKQLNNKQRYQLAKEDFEYWFSAAIRFYEIFDFCFSKKQYNESAFLLHQVTERLYTTILLVFTRYKPNTHDLSILRKLANAVDQRLVKIFPLRNFEEKYHFILLRNAYVDARYKKSYAITEEELTWLVQHVKALQETTDMICREKMESFLQAED